MAVDYFLKVTVGAVAGLSVFAGAVARAATLTYDQLFVFGDSLSDSGNVFQSSGGFPPLPYIQGRFSNGPNWVDYLAADLNLNPALFTQLGIGASPATGINFAFGGATTGTSNTIASTLPGLQQQVAAFSGLVASQQFTPSPNALYLVWVGANDYLPTTGVTSCSNTPGVACTQPTVPLQNLTQGLQTLVQSGARNILLVNLPPLGELPLTRNDPQAPALDQLTQVHNQGLSSLLPPGPQVTVLDVNALFQSVISNPGGFGFSNVTDACFSLTTPNFACTLNPQVQTTYLFWDEFHPTTTAHALIASTALANLPQPIPEPATTLGVLTAIGVLASRRLRR